jgi:hypothetical protein
VCRYSAAIRSLACSSDHHTIAAAPDEPDTLTHVGRGLFDCTSMSSLDLRALPRIAERPHDRDGLRCAERHVDPTTTPTPSALRAKPTPAVRMAALHQRDEVGALDRPVGPDPQPLQRLGIGKPATWGLRHLAVGGQVVVPALGRNGLALQVARVAAAPGRTYARRSHHTLNDREKAKTANQLHSDRIPVHLVCPEAAAERWRVAIEQRRTTAEGHVPARRRVEPAY